MKSPILFCFAVKEEAKFFSGASPDGAIKKLITGMGQRRAAAGIRSALAAERPRMVITAGFAGGLNPQLLAGAVVFDEGITGKAKEKLMALGGTPGKFYCADQVAVTAAEKWGLWQATGADAVEMESGVIRGICAEQNIPSATVRVISDAAGEDLPLDFNALMTADDTIDFKKLAVQLLKQPGNIPRLIGFQRQTVFAARKLGAALECAARFFLD